MSEDAVVPRARTGDTQRKRAQSDGSGGPPAKKSFLSKALTMVKSIIPFPWGKEEEEPRVIVVDDDDEEREEEGEEENEVDVIEEEEDVQIALEVITVRSSTDEEEVLEVVDEDDAPIFNEVREEEVVMVERSHEIKVYKRNISPIPSSSYTENSLRIRRIDGEKEKKEEEEREEPAVVQVDISEEDEEPEVLEVIKPLVATPTTTISPAQARMMMDYVIEQSSRVEQAGVMGGAAAHSPSQSSTTSTDRERLRVVDEFDGERDSSPLPEDSASRQHTPRSSYTDYGGGKRDSWRKKDRRQKQQQSEWSRMTRQNRTIGKTSSSSFVVSKVTIEKVKELHKSGRMDEIYNPSALNRYMEARMESQRAASAANHETMKQMAAAAAALTERQLPPPQQPALFQIRDLSTRQQLDLGEYKKRCQLGVQLAAQSIAVLAPRKEAETRDEETEEQQAGPSQQSDGEVAAYEDESRAAAGRSSSPDSESAAAAASAAASSPRSPNDSSCSSAYRSFHRIDKLADIQTSIQALQLENINEKLKFDIYKGLKPEADRKVKNLLDENILRTTHRLEEDKKHVIDARAKLALQGIVIPEPVKKIDEFPELSSEALDLCTQAFDRANTTRKFRDGEPPLHGKDLKTIDGLNWLNDDVILAYYNLIVERSKNDSSLPKVYAFNTFFYTNISNRAKGFASVKRWTKKVDIFSFDLLLIPVHLSVHWTMAVVDLREKQVCFLDSLGASSGGKHTSVEANHIMDYLEAESMDKRKQALNRSEWLCCARTDIPQQYNGSDCGMFACKFADFAARRAEFTFTQDHMPYYRKRMVIQLIKSDLAAH